MTGTRRHRRAGLRRVAMIVGALSSTVAGGPSHAQAPKPAPPGGAIVHPSPNIDPGIKVAPRRHVQLPMPVIHPPVVKGDTVIVPK